jgi:hypothetical protein
MMLPYYLHIRGGPGSRFSHCNSTKTQATSISVPLVSTRTIQRVAGDRFLAAASAHTTAPRTLRLGEPPDCFSESETTKARV